jgi:hypothetical protein
MQELQAQKKADPELTGSAYKVWDIIIAIER